MFEYYKIYDFDLFPYKEIINNKKYKLIRFVIFNLASLLCFILSFLTQKRISVAIMFLIFAIFLFIKSIFDYITIKENTIECFCIQNQNIMFGHENSKSKYILVGSMYKKNTLNDYSSVDISLFPGIKLFVDEETKINNYREINYENEKYSLLKNVLLETEKRNMLAIPYIYCMMKIKTFASEEEFENLREEMMLKINEENSLKFFVNFIKENLMIFSKRYKINEILSFSKKLLTKEEHDDILKYFSYDGYLVFSDYSRRNSYFF